MSRSTSSAVDQRHRAESESKPVGQPRERDYVLSNLHKLVVKRIQRSPRELPVLGSMLAKQELGELRDIFITTTLVQVFITILLFGGATYPLLNHFRLTHSAAEIERRRSTVAARS